MLSNKKIKFIENCNYSTLISMCDGMRKDCWKGADCKRDLVSHIVKHYQMYEDYTQEEILPVKIKMKCKKRRKEIEVIIHKYMMLAILGK